MKQIIYIGSDHRGFQLKNEILQYLNTHNFNPVDCGCFNETESADYPDIANVVTSKMLEQEGSMGVLICGSGIGMSIAANRSKDIRAALCLSEEDVMLSRQHNNANILCMGAKNSNTENAIHMVQVFLNTAFEGGRHSDRIEKIDKYAK